MKMIKILNKAVVYLQDTTIIEIENFTEEIKDFILKSTEDEIKTRFINEFAQIANEKAKIKKAKDLVKLSKIVVLEDGKFTIPSISNVSMPKYLVKKLVTAELNNDSDAIEGYKNFWTLTCQNPNKQARNNLLWFLDTHGFKILKSGLFVAYRNAISKKEDPLFSDEEVEIILKYIHNITKVQKKSLSKYYLIKVDGEIVITKECPTEGTLSLLDIRNRLRGRKTTSYTDNYTKTMHIELGVPVKIDRSLCDEDSTISCSAGLHLAKKDWEGLGSFGNVTLMCLCNPVNVVAVPKEGTYGKIRTCEYFPVKEVEKDENGNTVEDLRDGEELNYFDISYNGVINNESPNEFQLKVPSTESINYKKITHSLQDIKNKLNDNNINRD